MSRSLRSPGGRRAAGGDPRGLVAGGMPIAAVLSVLGLLLVAAGTLAISSGDLPFVSSGGQQPGPNGSGDPGTVTRTPTPSNVVVVPTPAPGITVPGTLVYAKDGNIWIQAGGKATQLTSGGTDSMPSFSPDGTAVFFVRTRPMTGNWPVSGVSKAYRMDVPSLMRVPTVGGDATRILDGVVDPSGRLKWMGFIREPVLSPDGRTVALVTDMPDPTRSDVVLKLYDLGRKRIVDPGLTEVIPLGHQDPAWRPDGLRLAYVVNDRDGAKGTPRIFLLNPATGKARAITGPGYLHPSWSPDGKYLAATRTSAIGTDVVILDAATGAELLRLTGDGDSWAPAWSPKGDQVAFLHVEGQVVDLRLIQLQGAARAWTASDPTDLTTSAGLDGASRPGWFIPADQLPATPPPATPSPAAPSASPSGS